MWNKSSRLFCQTPLDRKMIEASHPWESKCKLTRDEPLDVEYNLELCLKCLIILSFDVWRGGSLLEKGKPSRIFAIFKNCLAFNNCSPNECPFLLTINMAGRQQVTNNLLYMPHFYGFWELLWKCILKSPEKLAVLPMLSRLVSVGIHWCEVTRHGYFLLLLVLYLTGPRFKLQVPYLSWTKNSQGKLKKQPRSLIDSRMHSCQFPGHMALLRTVYKQKSFF